MRFPKGRRVSERRAKQVPATQVPELPRRARRYAEQLQFVHRLEPETLRAEDSDTQRLVARFQAGDRDAFSELYKRYFARVYSYLRLAIKDSHEAEDLAQQTFIQVLQNLMSYERREQPFRSWLFAIARNQAADHFRRTQAIPVEDPTEYMDHEAEDLPEPELNVLNWITDSDLAIFVERLSPAQRQALALRYMLGLNSQEAAEVMGKSPESVRMLQSRAVNFLRERLNALGRAPKTSRRPPIRRIERQARVLRVRRYGLSNPGPTG